MSCLGLFFLLLFPVSLELGGDEHGRADGPTSVSGDEGVHCVAGGQSGRCHVAEFVPCRGRECHKGKQLYSVIYSTRWAKGKKKGLKGGWSRRVG